MAVRNDFTAGEVLAAADLNDTFASKADVSVDLEAKTANYTLVLADAGKFITVDSASAQTVTIPASTAVAFPVGTNVGVAALH